MVCGRRDLFPRVSSLESISILIFPSLFHRLRPILFTSSSLLASSSSLTMGQSRSYHSALSGCSKLTVMPALRVSSVAVYGGHGEAVKLCVDAFSHSSSLLSTNTVSSCLMCAVNAHELERLKKRFMKLDRCHSSPSPHPAALCCPLP
jgi:hypothetical protein